MLADASNEKLHELNKRVLRKLDWRFLPCITMMLLMAYLDRINVANARLAGMQDDLGMNDVQWSAGISLFYVGYIISQIPGNIMIAKGKPRILLPAVMLGWSVVTICMPAVKTAWGFMLCCFLIGFCEGPFLPGVALLSSSWYTREESPLRMAIWHAGNIVSNGFSGLLAAAILGNMEGIASIAVGLIGLWGIPNFPNNTGAYFFTEEESQMAQYRALVTAGGMSEDDEGDYWGGFVIAIKDPMSWFVIIHFGLMVASAFKDFFPSIVKTLGFNQTVTYLIQAPPYIFAYFVTLVVSWSSGRNLEHCYHIVGAMVAAMGGAILMISTLNVGSRYFSLFLLCTGPFIGLNIHVPWEAAVVPRPRTKRAALIALANCTASVSNRFTPYFFLRTQEPPYQTGGGCLIVGCGMTIIACVATRYYCKHQNRKMDRHDGQTGEVTTWRMVL
ncbi:major facilitator superfamily transporter [Colletotrichum plurivorum]|uniref:Major facilitator superfamily transporter n=1 Tax=Colletotrichum plurivorum TaxID=2175906 RepID=A0A8H6N2W9_9PEZI|nr:major facilitator superfamily transporter [Colletotrichum plurivorum]